MAPLDIGVQSLAIGVAYATLLIAGAGLSFFFLRNPGTRRFGAAVLAGCVAFGGAGVAAAVYRTRNAYEMSRAVVVARSSVAAQREQEALERWSVTLTDLEVMASAEKLCQEVSCRPSPAQAAAWTGAMCEPLRLRCAFGSPCMLQFGDVWRAVQDAPWVEVDGGYTRRGATATVRASHQPRGSDQTLCLADFGP